MSDVEAKLTKSCAYLKEQAYASHLAGDGPRVAHLCAIALNAMLSNERLELSHVRWAVFLGLHWWVDDWYQYFVRSALGRAKKRNADPGLTSFAGFLAAAVSDGWDGDINGTVDVCAEWQSVDESDFADIVGITLAIEHVWIADPLAGAWKRVLDHWLANAGGSADDTRDTPLSRSLITLKDRLEIQSRFLVNGTCLADSVESGQRLDAVTHALLSCWDDFFDGRFGELDKKLQKLRPSIGADSPRFTQFSMIAHYSRTERATSAQDSQFLALSRVRYATTRHPSQFFDDIICERYSEHFVKLGRSDLRTAGAYDRFNCIRLAKMLQLHGLRRWEVQQWLDGRSRQGWSLIEIAAATGQHEQAATGLFTLAATGTLPKDWGPLVEACIRAYDSFDQARARALVEGLLSVRHFAWHAVYQLFVRLSDGIPESLLSDVARWSVRLETDPVYGKRSLTYLQFWEAILWDAESSPEILQILLPQLVERAKIPHCWQVLQSVFSAAVMRGTIEQAEALLSSLGVSSSSSSHEHFDEDLFTILLNAGTRPELREIALSVAHKLLERDPNDPIKAFYIRHFDGTRFERKDDSEFRSWLRSTLIEISDKCLSENSGKVSFGYRMLHEFVAKLTWPEAETELVEKLLEVINAPYVPYVNKTDPIACLAFLLDKEAEDRSVVISVALKAWLSQPIPGRDLGVGGPLSIIQFNGLGPDSMYRALWVLLDAFASQHPGMVEPELSTWVLRHANRAASGVVAELLRVLANLSTYYEQTDSLKSAGLAYLAAAMARARFESSPREVYVALRTTLFDRHSAPTPVSLGRSASESLREVAAESLLDVSRVTDPDARREAARLLVSWGSQEPLPGVLGVVLSKLSGDSRLRVRVVLKNQTAD